MVIDTYYKVNPDTRNGAFVSRTPNGDIWHEYDASTQLITLPAFGGISTINTQGNQPRTPEEIIGSANEDYLQWLADIQDVTPNVIADSPTPEIEEHHVITGSDISSTFSADGVQILDAQWFASSDEFTMASHNGGTFSYQAVFAWAKALDRFITLTRERN